MLAFACLYFTLGVDSTSSFSGSLYDVLLQLQGLRRAADLAVVRHECLANLLRAQHQLLQQLQRDAHHLPALGKRISSLRRRALQRGLVHSAAALLPRLSNISGRKIRGAGTALRQEAGVPKQTCFIPRFTTVAHTKHR